MNQFYFDNNIPINLAHLLSIIWNDGKSFYFWRFWFRQKFSRT